MKEKLIASGLFLAIFSLVALSPGGALLALNPQPEPPLPLNNLNPLITIPPADRLDPQPEPPGELPGIDPSIIRLPVDMLDPQPEPPSEISNPSEITEKLPVDALDPQPEPPMIARDIKILINNVPLDSLDPQPEPPMLYQDRTLVPMRTIFEQLGATVEWEGSTQTIIARKGSIVVKMKIGDVTASINGQIIFLDAPPLLHNDRTFVPLRFVSQALGNEVQWNDQTRTVNISVVAD